MRYYKKYKYFQKVQVIMNKKKSKNKKQDKQSEKPVPRKKEEEQTEGTGRNSAQNPCYGLLVCTGISYQRVIGRSLLIPLVIRIWCRSIIPLWKVAAHADR